MLGAMLTMLIEGGTSIGPIIVPDGPVRLRVLSSRTVKRGDTLPALRLQVCDVRGDPMELPEDATARVLIARGGRAVVAADAEITDPGSGVLQYAWRAGDLSAAGTHIVEVELRDVEGGLLTAPSDGYAELDVIADLG